MSLGLLPTGPVGELLGIGRRVVADGVDTGLLEEGATALTKLGNEASAIVQPEGEASSPPKEIQALRKAFEQTLDDLGVTLVVLVDDLDRCLPETPSPHSRPSVSSCSSRMRHSSLPPTST